MHAHALVSVYACACTWIRVSLRAFTRINANAVSCVRLHACSRTGLIKTQNAFASKNRKTQTHFGFRNFQDVLYIPVASQQLPFSLIDTLIVTLFT